MRIQVPSFIWSVFVSSTVFLTVPPQPASANELPANSRRVTPTVLAVSKVLPSVVNISTERIVKSRHRDPFARLFKDFFERDARFSRPVGEALGSGVIVDSKGLIMTNDHVVRRASRITVTLADGSNYDAIRIAMNEANDLALLRLQGLDPTMELKAVTFAAPDDIYLGEEVISVGNPLGLGHSVSVGVLSATKREIRLDDDVLFDDILQTDAAINAGNSGGPLVNVDAELIGINLATIQEGAQGIGFAIPLKRIEEVLSSWLIPSRFSLVSCGLVPGTRVLDNGKTEVVISELLADTPAAASALKVGDVIRAANGVAVTQSIELGRLLWRLTAGENLKLDLADGRSVELAVAAVEPLSGEELALKKLAVELQELTPRLAAALGLPHTHGLVVSEVKAGSVLSRRGVQRGDVIMKIGDVPVTKFSDVVRALNRLHHGDVTEIVIHRIEMWRGHAGIRRYHVSVPF